MAAGGGCPLTLGRMQWQLRTEHQTLGCRLSQTLWMEALGVAWNRTLRERMPADRQLCPGGGGGGGAVPDCSLRFSL